MEFSLDGQSLTAPMLEQGRESLGLHTVSPFNENTTDVAMVPNAMVLNALAVSTDY